MGKWTKAQRRVVVAIALTAMVVVGVSYWWLTGDYISGLGSSIALSFVVVLKMEKLFDERVGALFAKAGRDGFIAMNLALAVVLFAVRFASGRDPMLLGISPVTWFLSSACASWFVFLVSVTYHAYVKGE
ncbi:MAG: hypothetical protein NTV61_02905 [Candidatus Bathyarchaeota archaeon]|nr:hypothetical protein [Candidatus Bathyarchaeota archaeon]